ncbi:chemotaxis protein CheA [Variovorax sp. VNK109]|uniref:chemotaxis protein CheA n=1 Tax=Variovorax sp. VNK109 TaxID=3400919 RepID=UPI003C043E32
MNLDLSELSAIFVEEAGEHLQTLESRLLGLQAHAGADTDFNEIFRAAHSIKGGAATFGFAEVAEVAHVLETLLDQLRSRKLDVTGDLVDALLEGTDVIGTQLAAHQGQAKADPEAAQRSRERMSRLAGLAIPAPVDAPAAAAEPVARAAPVPGEGSAFGFFDDAPAATPTPAPDDGLASAAGAQAARAAPPASAHESSSIRVSTEKVDQLINLVGELVITQSMLAETLRPQANERLAAGLAQLERNTRELQEATMAIRMLPISAVFNRFPRMVRDLAGKLGKQVELRMSGEATELDKGLIEKITDPLTHLVRNSLDHGLESPAERIAAGKPATGVVTLRAAHQGGSIVVEVSDDGRGLRRDRIIAKARERGIPVEDDCPDAEVWNLIFEPGFSTAAQVTDVSGRGVGMDVVRSNITALGGRVDIFSEAGAGMRIVVRLPLTLAILDGLSVACGQEMFIVPLANIVESLRPAPDAVKSIAGQGRVVDVRGEYLPVLALHRVFGIEGAQSQEHDGILVVLEAEHGRFALFVDALVSQHQVVIKSLETHYGRVQGISGATILGDGRVALILDAAGLARQAHLERKYA